MALDRKLEQPRLSPHLLPRLRHPRTALPAPASRNGHVVPGFLVVSSGRINARHSLPHGQKLESFLCFFIPSFCCQLGPSTIFLNVLHVLSLVFSFDPFSGMTSSVLQLQL